MTPETKIKRAICQWLRLKHVFIFTHDSVGIYDPTRKRFRTNHDPFRKKGVSDVLGIWQGKFLAIEVKTPRTYATKEQKEFIEDVRANGGVAFIARSIEDVEAGLLAWIMRKDSE